MQVDEKDVALGPRDPEYAALRDLRLDALAEAERGNDLLSGVTRMQRQRDLGWEHGRFRARSRASIKDVEQFHEFGSHRCLFPHIREVAGD